MTAVSDHSARAHALLSASSSARWLACPPSAIAAKAYQNQDTEYTREGTLAHEVAELVARERQADRYPDLISYFAWPDGTDQEMVECAHGYADYIEEQTRSVDAAVLLEQRVDFSPWVPEGFGTADCIIIQGGTMDVIDYKYGKGVAVSAEDNPQMKLYGLGALNDFGFACEVTTVRMHIYQPRMNNISVYELPVAELLSWAEKTVKPTAAKAAKGKGAYKEGEHCRFCPHAGRCRKLTKACTEYVRTYTGRLGVKVLAPYEVADILAMEPMITLWLKRVKAQAMDTLIQGGEIPGYKVVEGKMGNRKWSDELAVAEKLKAEGYSLEDYTETKLLSPAALDKAIGKKKTAELLADLVTRTPGSPVIAPETDKRPAYNRVAEAVKDFEEETMR